VEDAGHREDDTLAPEPCDVLVQPAVDSRPQAVLEVPNDTQDEQQEAPKSMEAEKLVEVHGPSFGQVGM
jgi:hypothetical protein